jgi:hypothetical protein
MLLSYYHFGFVAVDGDGVGFDVDVDNEWVDTRMKRR